MTTLTDCIADGRGWHTRGGKPVTALGELPALIGFCRLELSRHITTDRDLQGVDAAACLKFLDRAAIAAAGLVAAAEEQAA